MDTQATRTFAGSPIRPLICSALPGLVAVLIVYVIFGTNRASTITDLIVLVGTSAFFAGVAIGYLVKASRSSGATVLVSPEGIIDRRLSSKLVPWNAVDGIGYGPLKQGLFRARIRAVWLKLDPSFESSRQYRKSLRLKAWMEHIGGRQGYVVKSAGLKVPPDELLTVVTAYKKVALDDTPIAERRMIGVDLPEATLRGVRMASDRAPYATFLLLGVLGVVFCGEGLFAPPDETVVTLSAKTLVTFGGMARNLVDQGQWWRFFTGPLLHAGPLHLVMNGIALAFGGFLLERLLGWRWFVSTFAIGALAGGAGSYFINPQNLVTVGASGGIVGLFAAMVVVALQHPLAFVRSTLLRGAAQVLIPTLIPIAHVGGGHVDVAAHCGGAIGGIVAGVLIISFWDARAYAPRGVLVATATSLAYVGASVFAFTMIGRAYEDRKALDPYLPSLFSTVLERAPELIKAHPRDPRIRYALAVKEIFDGDKLAEGEATLMSLADDHDAERLWPGIGETARKALAMAKADLAAGRQPFAERNTQAR